MANLKNTTIDDTVFRLPTGDTAARPASPAATQLRFNTDTGQLEQFRPGLGAWIAPSNTGVIATGGDAVYDVDAEGTTYRVHVFTATGTSTFEVSQGGEVEYLIVAGGGGANFNASSSASGAGGGAGGLLTGKNNITSQTYTVTVGQGGSKPSSAGTPWNNAAGSGEDSNVFGITAIGGGNGGTYSGSTGGSGGSGGGRGGSTSFGTNGGSGIPGQGNDGGPGNRIAGAGGGAGSPGEFRDATDGRGNFGGIGISSNITGQSHFYAGGGSSGSRNSSEIAPGGLGGGGTGGTSSAGFGLGQNGTSNTGGGGGGGEEDGSNNSGGAGGSGIVIIRYPLRQNNPETAAGQDVRNGLVLDLDFAKPTVYSGSGSVVTDSRLNGFEGEINGSPISKYTRTHRSAIETPANQTTTWIRLPEKALQSLPNGTVWTLEWAMTILSHSGTRYCHSMASSSTANNLIWQINDNDMRLYQGSLQSGADPSYSIGTPILLTLTRNNSTFRIYKNGAFAAEYSASRDSQNEVEGWVQDQEQDSILGDFESNQNTHADWFFNRLYSRVLLDSEIEQNFNFFRWRFGV